MKTKLLIIGSGPAGYTAGIYAARAMLQPVIVEGIQPGGQLTITTEVENWPGQITQGPELMQNMAEHAKEMGAVTVSDHIHELNLSSRPFIAKGESGEIYEAEAVILATGANAKWLNIDSEQEYKGFGVSACATCDGFFYRDKTVLVIGGGNTAVEEALFLTNFAKKVILVHRRDELRAERILQDRLFKHEKIECKFNYQLHEVLGTKDPKGVTGAILKAVDSEKVEEVACDGIFIAIGHAPASTLVEGQLPLKQGGYVITKPDSTQTEIPGVFAAGDITDDTYKQAITSAGMGCMAALEAERFLAEQE